jgi:hypothetical protein
MRKTSLMITFSIRPDGAKHIALGRAAWALQQLLKAGDKGCTPITHPGPRWSHYVWLLRGMGVLIETIHEPHGGPFPGTHAKYTLKSELDIISDSSKRDAEGIAA